MNRQQLEELIDDEVDKVFDIISKINIREPQPEPVHAQPQAPMARRAELTNDELDTILFYGGEKPESE